MLLNKTFLNLHCSGRIMVWRRLPARPAIHRVLIIDWIIFLVLMSTSTGCCIKPNMLRAGHELNRERERVRMSTIRVSAIESTENAKITTYFTADLDELPSNHKLLIRPEMSELVVWTETLGSGPPCKSITQVQRRGEAWAYRSIDNWTQQAKTDLAAKPYSSTLVHLQYIPILLSENPRNETKFNAIAKIDIVPLAAYGRVSANDLFRFNFVLKEDNNKVRTVDLNVGSGLIGCISSRASGINLPQILVLEGLRVDKCYDQLLETIVNAESLGDWYLRDMTWHPVERSIRVHIDGRRTFEQPWRPKLSAADVLLAVVGPPRIPHSDPYYPMIIQAVGTKPVLLMVSRHHGCFLADREHFTFELMPNDEVRILPPDFCFTRWYGDGKGHAK